MYRREQISLYKNAHKNRHMKPLRLGVDARPLLAGQLSGIPLAGLLLLQELQQDERVEITLFANRYNALLGANATQPVSPDVRAHWKSLEALVMDPNVPNRLINTLAVATGRPSLESFLGKQDAIWLPNVGFGRVRQAKTCVSVHDLSFLLLPETYSLKRRMWHRVVQARRQIRAADVVCAVSHATARTVVDHLGVPSQRVHVVHLGAPVLHATPERPGLLKHVEDPFFLYVGNIEPRKNLLQLVRAFESAVRQYDLPHRLVLAGTTGWKAKQCIETVERSRYRERIVFTGYVSEAEKSWLFRNAETFVYPSLYEGFGLPVLEAFCAGTPVVASSTPALAEVSHDAAILVHPYDSEELAYAMAQMAVDAQLRAQCRERGRERVKAFSWRRSARQLVDALDRVTQATRIHV